MRKPATPQKPTTNNPKTEQKQNPSKDSDKTSVAAQPEKPAKSTTFATCPFCLKGEHRIKDCPMVISGNCEQKGHLTRDCPKQKQTENKLALLSKASSPDRMICVQINGTDQSAFVDTGSDANFITISKAKELSIPFLEVDDVEIKATTLIGLKGVRSNNIGIARIPLTLGGKRISAKFYIVNDSDIPTPLQIVIGYNLLQQPNVILRVANGVTTI